MGLDKKGPITLSIALEEIAAVLQDGARSAVITMREMNRVMANQPPVKIEPAPDEVAERIVRDMTRKIDAALFAGRLPDPGLEIATGYTDPGWEEEEPTVPSFDDLLDLVEGLRPKEPMPTEVWFVDRPHMYWELISSLPPGEDDGVYQRLMGMPVVRWDYHFFDPEREIIAGRDDDHLELVQQHEDKKVWPWVCNHPGIWARMSDGSWQRIEIVTRRTT